MYTPTTIEDVIGDDYAKFVALSGVASKLRESRLICQHDVVAVESICPNILLGKKELRDFSATPDAYNYDYALEKIDLKRLGFIGKMIQAIIDFIKRLFKGRRNDKNQPKDLKDNIDKAVEKAVELDKVVEEKAEDVAIVAFEDLPKVKLEEMRQHLKGLGIDQESIDTWCKDWASFRSCVFTTHDFRRVVYNRCFSASFFNILLDNDYALIQDNLGTTLRLLETEAKARCDFMQSYADALLGKNKDWTKASIGINRSDLETLPVYNSDIGMLRVLLKIDGKDTPDLDVVTQFTAYITDMFTASKRISDDLLTHLSQMPMRYTDSLKNGLIAVANYNEYFTKHGVDGLSILQRHLDSAMQLSLLEPEMREALILALTNIVRVTSKLSSTMVIIADRGAQLSNTIEKGCLDIDKAITTVEKLSREIITEYVKMSPEDADKLVNFRNRPPSTKRHNKIGMPRQSLEDVTATLDILYRNETVCRQDISPVIGLVPNLPALEAYPVVSTKLHYTVTVEGLREKAKELIAKIVDKISELFDRFMKWLKGNDKQVDEMYARKKKLFGDDAKGEYHLKMANDQREYFAKFYEIAASDQSLLALFRRTVESTLKTTQVTHSTDLSREIEKYHGTGLYDFMADYSTRNVFTIMERELMLNDSPHTKARKLFLQEFNRRYNVVQADIDLLSECIKTDKNPDIVHDDESENDFMRTIVPLLSVPYTPSNIKGGNAGLTDGNKESDKSINGQKLDALDMVMKVVNDDFRDKDETGVSLAQLETVAWSELVRQEGEERDISKYYQVTRDLFSELGKRIRSNRTYATQEQIKLLNQIAYQTDALSTLSGIISLYLRSSLSLVLKQPRLTQSCHKTIMEFAKLVGQVTTIDSSKRESIAKLLSEYDDIHSKKMDIGGLFKNDPFENLFTS